VSSNKKPRFDRAPSDSTKVPRVNENPNAYYERHPVWRFSLLDVGCPLYGWNLLDGGTLFEIRDRLAYYERMTFREIVDAKCHEIETWKLCKDARDRVEELRIHPESIMSFRVNSRGRIWGVRTGNVVDLLWWDPKHAVYPVYAK
jgi:hypothetical protein